MKTFGEEVNGFCHAQDKGASVIWAKLDRKAAESQLLGDHPGRDN